MSSTISFTVELITSCQMLSAIESEMGDATGMGNGGNTLSTTETGGNERAAGSWDWVSWSSANQASLSSTPLVSKLSWGRWFRVGSAGTGPLAMIRLTGQVLLFSINWKDLRVEGNFSGKSIKLDLSKLTTSFDTSTGRLWNSHHRAASSLSSKPRRFTRLLKWSYEK